MSAKAQNPNYNSLNHWAAHPDKKDASDWTKQDSADSKIDVFFVYPTLYMDPEFGYFNADINDSKLNKEIEETAIKFQASVFNGLANVYAPFYRQMHYNGYFVTDPVQQKKAREAFDTAYTDVLKAFEHYLDFENNGRPFVIAGHSQGTNHSERLLKERILTDDALKNQLMLAYLVGMPIRDDFDGLGPCKDALQTGCFVSWRTFGNGEKPKDVGEDIVCTNPVTFELKGESSCKNHQGVLFPNGKIKATKSIDASAQNGYLNIELSKFPFGMFYKWGNYHKADYNLFWPNIRENFEKRVARIAN